MAFYQMHKRFLFRLFVGLFLFGPSCLLAAQTEPEFALQDQLNKHRGEVIYVDFWASWCKPCRHSFPWMNNMLAKYKAQGFHIVTVNLDKERKLADAFLQENPASFDIIFDSEGELARKFSLKGMPMSFILGRDGEVAGAHVGFNDQQKLKYEKEIIQLLEQARSVSDSTQ